MNQSFLNFCPDFSTTNRSSDYPRHSYGKVPMMDPSISKETLYRHHPSRYRLLTSCLLLTSGLLLVAACCMLYKDCDWSSGCTETYFHQVVTAVESLRISAKITKSYTGQKIDQRSSEKCGVPIRLRIGCYPEASREQCLSKGFKRNFSFTFMLHLCYCFTT